MTGPGHTFAAYRLPRTADLAGLESQNRSAMSDGTRIKADLSGPWDTGVLILNGARLPFVVLCPPAHWG